MNRILKAQVIILFFLLSIMAGLLIQDVYVSVFRIEKIENREVVYPQYMSGLSGFTQDDSGQYHTENDDPQMGFTFPARQINRVTIRFESPSRESINVCIYYATEEQGFAQERCVGLNCKESEKVIQIDLPTGSYDKIRVDIGNRAGLTFSLDSIVVSKVSPAFSWPVFVSVTVLVFLLLLQAKEWFEKRVFRIGYLMVFLDLVLISIIILQIGDMPVYRYLIIGLAAAFIFEEAEFLFGHRAKED